MKCFVKDPSLRRNPKEVFPNSRDIIVYAFSIDDGVETTDYYEFGDFNNVPCERGFQCLAFYNELAMRCTREYLLAFSAALDNTLNSPKIKLTDVFTLNQQLKERLEMLHENEIAYKLCSVVFFDGQENPYRFDYKHSIEKADRFRKAPIDQFFFLKPVTQVLPYLATWSEDLREYCELTTRMTESHIRSISTMLSEADKSKEYYRLLESLVQKVSA